MKTKDLLKAIEAANFVAERTNGKRAFIECETLSFCRGYTLELSVENVRTKERRFYNWDDLAASIAADYSKDVQTLIAKGTLKETSTKGIFILANAEYLDGMALRFFIYNN